ncbi:hypothetical protein ACPV5J_23675 [Vibrio rotiferianus]|uniref:hypothetical protein n=1 Tax=Vibrio rotiferianus TaxID=190895 RepID=UPI00406A5405
MLVVFLAGFFSYLSLGESNATKRGFILAAAIFCALYAGFSVYQQDIDKTKSIDRLSRVGSHIYWDEVRVKYHAIDTPNKVDELELTAAIKIASKQRSSFGKAIDTSGVLTRAKKVHAYDFLLLQHEDALAIYTSHADEQRRIVIQDEVDSNIHSFWFHTESIKNGFTFDITNSLKHEYGANARTLYRSLYDLNGAFVIFEIGDQKGRKLNTGSVHLELKSHLGFDVIPIMLSTEMLERYNGQKLFFGVYIPEDYWTLE